MFKKIKRFLNLQKRIQFEVLETLSSICLYLEFDARRNRYTEHMRSHFIELKNLSQTLREEINDHESKDHKNIFREEFE